MDWGSVAEWFNGGATALATAAASFAGVVAYRAYQRDEAKDRRGDAAVVHAWLARDTDHPTDAQRLVLVNAGVSLIYDVRVRLVMNDAELVAPSRDGTWRFLPAGTFSVKQHPTYGWTFPEPAPGPLKYHPYTRSDKYLVDSIEFTDAHGIRWIRDRTGKLMEIVNEAFGA